MEQRGWKLRGPVERIWAGERERDALVAGLDASDTAVIERVLALIEQRHEPSPEAIAAREALINSLPETVRTALLQGNGTAFQAALESLPEAQRTAVITRLQEAGIIGRGPDMAEVLRQFEPLLRGIATVATGNDGQLDAITRDLAQLEQQGWQLTNAVQRMWAGERDEALLTAGIDANSALLVRRVLDILRHAGPDVPRKRTSPWAWVRKLFRM